MLLKKGILSNSIIYFSMIIIFVFILLFSFNRFNDISKIIEDEELRDIKFKIENGIKDCMDDPLNKGKLNNINLKSNKFNAICILPESNPIYNSTIYEEFTTIKQGRDNVVLFEADLDKETGNIIGINNILESFEIEYKFSELECIADNFTGNLEINIKC